MSTLGHFTMATRRVGLNLVVRLSFVTDQPMYSVVWDYTVTPADAPAVFGRHSPMDGLGDTPLRQRATARERAFKWLVEQEREVEVRRGIPVGYKVGLAFNCVECAVPLHATTPATPATTVYAPSQLPGGTPGQGELVCDSCGRTVVADIRRTTSAGRK